MDVIYIGDRLAGKTTLAANLASTKGICVHPLDEDPSLLPVKGSYSPTPNLQERPMKMKVLLPTGYRSLEAQWLDTPGEIWRKSWQSNDPQQWQQILQKTRQSHGILLVLPPYRELVRLDPQTAEEFMTRQQWCNRFRRWVEFFRSQCPKVRHLALCLNMADLFCKDLEAESQRLGFSERGGSMSWGERDRYVMNTYFEPIMDQIAELNGSLDGLAARCFITSSYNRRLMELPWMYLATYLGR
jgi:hypothetical protein